MRTSYRYAIVLVLLLGALFFKKQSAPVHPNTDDVLPEFSALTCQISQPAPLPYKTGSNELTLSGVLRSVRNGDYHISFSSQYTQLSNPQDSSTEQPITAGNYTLQAVVVNTLQQSRVIGNFPVPTTGQTSFDYIGQDGDYDLQLSLIPTNSAADTSTRLYVHSFRVIPESDLNYQQPNRSYQSETIAAIGEAKNYNLSGQKLAIPFSVNSSTTLAQLGLYMSLVGNGGTGTYNLTLTNSSGRLLSFEQFTSGTLATLNQSLTNNPSVGRFYLPLPYQLTASYKYVLILSGQNVVGNKSNNLRLSAVPTTNKGTVSGSIGDGLSWVDTSLELVTTDQEGVLSVIHSSETNQGYVSYQNQGSYLDYFDAISAGGDKRYDSFNNAVITNGTGSLIYELSDPSALINIIGVQINQSCQNNSPIALSYSTNDRTWNPMLLTTDTTIHATQTITPSASVWVKVSSSVPRSDNVLAIQNISITGEWENGQ